MEYAHERGIVHRDLKPANVKVTNDDAVKVLDFGLAKTMQAETALVTTITSPTLSQMATQAGMLLGTAAYMSPEQARGKVVDRRADIWAFGCVLYEMLTGKMVFGGGAVTDTLAAVLPRGTGLVAATCGDAGPRSGAVAALLAERCEAAIAVYWRCAYFARRVLSGAPDPTLVGMEQTAVPLWRRALPWALFGATAVALGLLAWAPWHRGQRARARRARPFSDPPTGKDDHDDHWHIRALP